MGAKLEPRHANTAEVLAWNDGQSLPTAAFAPQEQWAERNS